MLKNVTSHYVVVKCDIFRMKNNNNNKYSGYRWTPLGTEPFVTLDQFQPDNSKST